MSDTTLALIASLLVSIDKALSKQQEQLDRIEASMKGKKGK